MRAYWVLALALSGLARLSICFDVVQHYRTEFERSFHERCDKYPFVAQYVQRLESTDDRYLTYVYQEKGLNNGGMGDKLGGLISATAMALRFNRTLLVRSENALHEIFRPYHPTDIHAQSPKYNWGDWGWSKWDSKMANHDETEYDLYDCINHTGQANEHCSMANGDVTQPHILLRSNRVYLCYYENNPYKAAYNELKALGVDSDSDLWEVGGCMLRLALWPTEKLWVSVGKELTRLAEIPAGHKGDRQRQRRRLQTEQPKQQRLFDHRQQQQNGTQPHLVRSSARLQEAKTETGGGGAEVEVGTTALTAAAASYTASATSDTGAGTVALPLAVFMVGMHYRCGDNSYIHKGGYDHMCTWEANPFEQKAPMYRLGNPQQIGLCAKETIAGLKGDNTPLGPIIGPNTLTLGLVASDNVPASLQMRQALGLSRSIVSSEGCQSAMDPSAQCHESTATQWFVLALCDVLVTQENMPSGFSRSAGIYGLRYDPFRNALNCEQPQNNSHHSHSQHANWFC